MDELYSIDGGSLILPNEEIDGGNIYIVKGDKGDIGKNFTILGYFSDLTALIAAVPNPQVGDAYGIGTAAPYDIYIFDGVSKQWENNGNIKGEDGKTATISVSTTTTLEAGQDATVTNTGTPSNAILNFGIPKGETGGIGAKGSDGKSAFQAAVDGGFTGNETQFNAMLAQTPKAVDLANFMTGVLTRTTMAAMPITNAHIVVSTAVATAWSWANTPAAGQMFHILLKNTGSSDFTQPIPNAGSWDSNNEATVVVKVGCYVELSCWYIDSKYIVIVREP